MTSDSVKSVDGSDSVKVTKAVSPAMSEETLEEILILGEDVSTPLARLIISSDA